MKYIALQSFGGRYVVVRIATRYDMDGSGFEFQWGQEISSSPHPSRPALRLTHPHGQWPPEHCLGCKAVAASP